MSNKNFSRMERVEREISSLLSAYFIAHIQTEFDFLVSLTTVKVTKDLRNANVYVSVLGSEEQEKEALDYIKQVRSEIQLHLGKSLRTKYVPKLQFFSDDTYAENFRIMGRLKELGFEHKHDDLID